LPVLAVLIFGLVVLYAVGFSNFARAHNAAHDARHANGFPCH
jgi:cobalt transporter subunit CbtB